MPATEAPAACPHLSVVANDASEVELWQRGWTSGLGAVLVKPRRFERHIDHGVPAVRILGFDAGGKPCYFRQHYAIREERFDEDDLPVRVETHREQVTAWRLADGRWLHVAARVSGFAECGNRIERSVYIADAAPQ